MFGTEAVINGSVSAAVNQLLKYSDNFMSVIRPGNTNKNQANVLSCSTLLKTIQHS